MPFPVSILAVKNSERLDHRWKIIKGTWKRTQIFANKGSLSPCCDQIQELAQGCAGSVNFGLIEIYIFSTQEFNKEIVNTKMAGLVKTKTVCFIASAVIVWSLFEFGEAIAAWSDYKTRCEILYCLFPKIIYPIRYIVAKTMYWIARCTANERHRTKLFILSMMLVYLDPSGCPFWLSLSIKIWICIYFALNITKYVLEG